MSDTYETIVEVAKGPMLRSGSVSLLVLLLQHWDLGREERCRIACYGFLCYFVLDLILVLFGRLLCLRYTQKTLRVCLTVFCMLSCIGTVMQSQQTVALLSKKK